MAKILLDENLPVRLRHLLAPHDAYTVAYMKWGGMKNGELLDAAEDAEYEVFITADKSLEYENQIAGRKIAVVSLSANAWSIVRHHVAEILTGVDGAQAGTVTRVDFGRFERRQKPKGLDLG